MQVTGHAGRRGHGPPYGHCQRRNATGIRRSRALLLPVSLAQHPHIFASAVLAMGETAPTANRCSHVHPYASVNMAMAC